jgi:hypothetical protein
VRLREGEVSGGAGLLEMAGVGRSQPYRASWARNPRCASSRARERLEAAGLTGEAHRSAGGNA